MGDGLRCSFCEKSQHEVRKLVAGAGGGHICDTCVSIAARIIADSDRGRLTGWRRVLARVRTLADRLRGGAVAMDAVG